MHVPGKATDGQQGAVIYNYNNIDTYRFVEPVTATTTAKKPFVNWKWLGLGLGGVLILLGGMFFLSRRIKPRETE